MPLTVVSPDASSWADITLLCFPSVTLRVSLDFSNVIAGNLSPSWGCSRLYPFINSSQSWDPAVLRSREDGIVSSLAETGQVQAGTSHTEICLSRHSKRAVCLLPEQQSALIMHTKTLGGAIIFKCNFIAERPESAVVSLQMSDNPPLSQADRTCYYILLPSVGADLRRIVSSQLGHNSRALSRPRYILKVYLSTQMYKSPWNSFCQVCTGL